MKVKVIKRFRDAETGTIHENGDVLNISKKRLMEIQKVGDFVTEIDESTKKDEPEE